MKSTLGQFQDDFIEALYQRPAPTMADLTEQAGFSVYRNTVIKGCSDALCDNLPSVERLVGREWLSAAAAIYARSTPPVDARLIHYGKDFPEFIRHFEPARELPYLADVAVLDLLWIEAFAAAEEPVLRLGELHGMTAADLAQQCLTPRASTRWQWFTGQPIYSLWRSSREAQPIPEPLPWQSEGALLYRSPAGVSWQPLEHGGCVFLSACADGLVLDQASALAIAAQPDMDFTDLLSRLLGAAAFSAPSRI